MRKKKENPEVASFKKSIEDPEVKIKQLGLSTGSTLLNLSCSGKPHFGLITGQYYLFVGDSNSGKTFITRNILAEAANNPKFDNYRFIFDDPEGGSLMDNVRFFGKKMADRLEPPNKDKKGEAVNSETIEDFYFNLDDACKGDKPFIYILDSIDGLYSIAEDEKFNKDKKALRKIKEDTDTDEKVKGSYGDGKAKKNSSNIRRILPKLSKKKSILIIINQTRDNIGYGAMFNPKTRSGGNALEFYACIQLWTSKAGEISKTYKKKKRQLGLTSLIKVKRSRITGRSRDIKIPIYHSYGMDNIGSCINYLIEEGHWSGTKGEKKDKQDKQGKKVKAPEFNFEGPIDKLIEKIEQEDLEKDLIALVSSVWEDIEEACKVKRKPKYE